LTAESSKMMTTGMLRKVAARSARDNYSELMLSAPLIGLIAVRDRYDQEQCLQAGRGWQRAHLLATARGLAARPSNEAVEMVDHERALANPASREALLSAITGDRTWQPTFVFYMGYPRSEEHTTELQSRGHLVCRLLLEKKNPRYCAGGPPAVGRCADRAARAAVLARAAEPVVDFAYGAARVVANACVVAVAVFVRAPGA